MSKLQFYIRHQDHFLQDKFILVFRSEAARDLIQRAIPGSRFEKVTSQVAQHAARIGINGKTVPYGYTIKLTEAEMDRLGTVNWDETAELLAEGNERLYQAIKEREKDDH